MGVEYSEMTEEQVKLQWCGEKLSSQFPDVIRAAISEDGRNFSVILEPAIVSCPPGTPSSVFTMDIARTSRKNHTLRFSETGYLAVGNYYFPSKGFCIMNWAGTEVTVRECGNFSISKSLQNFSLETPFPAERVGNIPSLPKCCWMNEKLTVTPGRKKICQETYYSQTFNQILSSRISTAASLNKESTFVFRNPLDRCGENQILHLYERFCFRIQDDGTLIYRDHYYNWIQIPKTNYCIDGVQFEGAEINHHISLLGEEQNYGFVTCTPRYEYHYLGTIITTIYGTACIVGSVFLFLTFLVYALVWEQQKLQGWITMSHSATMFFWYSSLGWGLLIDPKVPNRYERSNLCILLGILQHFFVLSNFCWLTGMSFSLFWTIRDISVHKLHIKNTSKYIIYAVFGWGLPFVIVLVSIILDQKHSYDPCNMVVVPEYGFQICFVSHSALGMYIYYPVTTIMTLNLICFATTSYKLYNYKKSTSLARVNIKKDYELFQMIGKLFLLTGFVYILEFVTWLQCRLLSGSESIPWYSSIVNVSGMPTDKWVGFAHFYTKLNIIDA
ncbi:unnamed protein product [Allacma fusca]|uniref:G-protein coupled receptors family 2 profile 2 domain-containing protein n=1 Tax=Allacma fusca TaxID=39272 RepID=A0A8J2KBM0_9HEXA|nr:unnamed protein product [Allacma fusca]